MSAKQILITGGLVLVGEPSDGQFERTDVLIRDGAIAAFGPNLRVAEAEVIDATGMIVMPGFVDTHHHLWETSMRGISADWDIIDFTWGIRFHHASIHTAEDVYAGTFAGAIAALDAGITTTLDFDHAVNSPDHACEGVRAARDAGIRTIWSYGLTDAGNTEFSTPQDRLDDLHRLRSEQFSSEDIADLVTLGIAVNDIGGVPWSQTKSEFELARELQILLAAHTDSTWSALAVPEIEWLNREGLLGPRQVHTHVNSASDTELKLLADSGAALSSTPETELQMAMGFPIFARAADLGVSVGLGTDIQANNSADPFAHMQLAMHAENARFNQPILQTSGTGGLNGIHVSTRDILHHATLGGACTLGLDSVTGSIEQGKRADILLVKMTGVHQRPVVLHSRASDIDTVIVDGEIVKRAGVLNGDRADRAVKLVDATWERLAPQMEARGGQLPERPDGLLEQMVAASVSNAPPWLAAESGTPQD